MSKEQTTFNFNEEPSDNLNDLISIQISSEVITINYYQLIKWSKVVREKYPKPEIKNLSKDIQQYQQKYKIGLENIKLFFQSISNEQVQITINQYFDFKRLSKILGVIVFERILQKFAQNHIHDVDFIIKILKDQISFQNDDIVNDLIC